MSDRAVYITATIMMVAVIVLGLVTAGSDIFTTIP